MGIEVLAGLLFLTRQRVDFAAGRGDRTGGTLDLRLFRMPLSCALLVLGFNRQLDLQSLLTQIGRDLAITQG